MKEIAVDTNMEQRRLGERRVFDNSRQKKRFVLALAKLAALVFVCVALLVTIVNLIIDIAS